MIVASKEFFSIVKDRDYLTMVFCLIFCFSLLGFTINIFSSGDSGFLVMASINIFNLRDSGLLLMATILCRLLYIYRASTMFDNFSSLLYERMNYERDKPGFINGNLTKIMENEFPRIDNCIKMKCMKKLEDEMELDMSPSGDYIFYPAKVFFQPGKDRRSSRKP
jgi:hypothetical protein